MELFSADERTDLWFEDALNLLTTHYKDFFQEIANTYAMIMAEVEKGDNHYEIAEKLVEINEKLLEKRKLWGEAKYHLLLLAMKDSILTYALTKEMMYNLRDLRTQFAIEVLEIQDHYKERKYLNRIFNEGC